jgi:hypothetical protein
MLCASEQAARMVLQRGVLNAAALNRGADLRDELGLQPGAEVEFQRDGAAVRIIAAGAAVTRGLRGRYADSGMANALLSDRAQEPR